MISVIFLTISFGWVIYRKLQKMENYLTEVNFPPTALTMQKIENIEFVLKELEAVSKTSNNRSQHPTYKTLFRLNFAFFYERFGETKTNLFKLTNTHYLDRLPELCVVHTIPELEQHKDCPLLIEDIIFISHQYFKDWLISTDKDFYEREILELILSNLEIDINYASN